MSDGTDDAKAPTAGAPDDPFPGFSQLTGAMLASECLNTEWENVCHRFQRFAHAVSRQTQTDITLSVKIDVSISEMPANQSGPTGSPARGVAPGISEGGEK